MSRVYPLVIFILLTGILHSEAKDRLMTLQIKTSTLRSAPAFWASANATVNYGDRLSVIETKGDWSKVSPVDTDKSGWIHNSALTKKKLELKAADSTEIAASSGELALAGKGFNSKVEAEFKAKNKDIDFTWIDKMEKMVIPYTKMKEFLKEGKITPKGGDK